MDHQDAYGCRKCSNGYDVFAFPGTGLQHVGGAQAARVLGLQHDQPWLLMNRARKGNETHQLELD